MSTSAVRPANGRRSPDWLAPVTRGWVRGAQVIALIVAGAYAAEVAHQAILTWTIADMDAYWNAALRIRAGQQLFPPGVVDWAPTVFHYAPWFAWLWVPVTYLPHDAVRVGWSILLVLATAAAVAPLVHVRSLAALLVGLIVGSNLLAIASGGNVQPILVAGLVWSLDRKWSGPAWIAVCASLKLAPVVLVAVFVGRREWNRVLLTVALTALLFATYATADLTWYPRTLPGSLSLAEIHTGLWVLASIAAFVGAVTIANRRSRFSWLAAVVSVLVASPRLGYIESTYLLAAVPRDRARERDEARDQAPSHERR